jgi:hypothetical protein
MRHGLHRKATADHSASKKDGKEQQCLFVHMEQAEGGQRKADEFAAGIPSVERRISWKEVES